MGKWLKLVLVAIVFFATLAVVVYLYMSSKSDSTDLDKSDNMSTNQNTQVPENSAVKPPSTQEPEVTPVPGSVTFSQYGTFSKSANTFTYQGPDSDYIVDVKFDDESECNLGDGVVKCNEEQLVDGQYNLDGIEENGEVTVRSLVLII